MKPDSLKGKRLQEIRTMQKRKRAIGKEMYDLGYYKLEEPIRHGWYKEVIITENVHRYKNREAITEVFEKIEKYAWGRTKMEAEKKWLQQTSKYIINQEVPTLSHKSFNKLSSKAKLLCVPFYYKNEQKKKRLRFYVKIPKNTYKIKFTRAFITHRKRIDPSLESEYDFLEKLIYRNGYYQAALKGDSYYNTWCIPKIIKERKHYKMKLRKWQHKA